MCKRIQAFVLSIALAVACAAPVYGSGGTQQRILKMTDETFSKASSNNANVFGLTDEVTFGGESSALEIDFSGYGGSDANLTMDFSKFDNVTSDWSSYDNLKIRLYANEAGGRFNIVTMTGPSASSSTYSYGRFTLTINEAQQWTEVTLPLSGFTEVKCALNSFSWSTIWGLRINLGGWGTTVSPSTVVYIDEIWLDAEEEEQGGGNEEPVDESDDVSIDGMRVIKRFDSEAKIAPISNLTADTGITRLHDVSARFNIGTTDMRFNVFPNNAQSSSADNAINVTAEGYRYLNQWVYSPEAVEGGNFLGLVYASSDLQSDRIYYRYTIPVNWSGWKLVSIDLSTGTASNASSFSWSDVRWVAYNVNGFDLRPGVAHLNFDMIFFSKTLPSELSGQVTGNPAPRSLGMPTRGMVADIAFSNPILSVDDNSVIASANGQPLAGGFTTGVENGVLRVAFNQELDHNTDYEIIFGNQIFDIYGYSPPPSTKYNFTTMPQRLLVSKPVFENGLGGALTEMPVSGDIAATAQASNLTGTEKTVVLALAVYTCDGTMVYLALDEAVMVPGENASLTATVNGNFEACHAKAFVLNTTQGMKMARHDYSVLGLDEQRVYYGALGSGSSSLTIDKANISINNLRIEGKLSHSSNSVLITLRDEDGDPVLLVPVSPEPSGRFTYEYLFDETKSGGGDYTVSAVSMDSADAESVVFNYISAYERENILSGVNTVGSPTAVKDLLFAIDRNLEYGDNVAVVLYEHRPFARYEDMTDMLAIAQAVSQKLESIGWLEMAEFLRTYESIILHNHPDYGYYSGLSAKNQNTINEKLLRTSCSIFTEFRDAFAEEVDAYKKSLSDSQPSNGGRGDVSGGKSSYTVDSKLVSQANEKNHMNEGGRQEGVFDDLGQADWARESILLLYDLGVVSGSENKTFRPMDPVTREEFVKMLVAAFNIPVEQRVSSFSDVHPDEWYSEYIAAAQSLGVVNGDSGGNFGVGQSITRQDMAAMAYRTLTVLGKSLSDQVRQMVFEDERFIAGYALEAVYEMQRAGILSGMDGRIFAPLDASNRAQAAKVIAMLITAAR